MIVQNMLTAIGTMVTAAEPEGGGSHWTLTMIVVLPLVSFVLCGLCAAFKVKSKLPAWITVASLAAAFVFTLMAFMNAGPMIAAAGAEHGAEHAAASAEHAGHLTVHVFDWLNFDWGGGKSSSGRFDADFGFYIDGLTLLWMLFVTGLGTLIALYASEYMAHDVGLGYCRFFAAFSLFVLSMSCLVMASNLLMLFFGWEGVGLCSYLLIGYFYKKPAAVAAAKKAFIVNRIGDLGLLMGILGVYAAFGTVQYDKVFEFIHKGVDAGGHPLTTSSWIPVILPLLLTAGAFGKSAQLFFYVWLPDAMEGPTPVSALIHAATMVTAGVFLIARMMPLYTIDPAHTILTFVAWGGTITAFWAATIGMAHFDIKRVMGYSTASQLGYMFAGLGVMNSAGGAAHVFSHAFFKATLFLACGAVMHGFAGQLDLRKLSGVRKLPGWKIVAAAMFFGALNLSGVTFTAGFWSKDLILASSFEQSPAIGWILLITAGLTAYYTFRAYFRVFEGPVYFEPGDEVHGHDEHEDHAGHGHDGHGEESHAHDGHAQGHGHGGEFHPHAPGWAINTVLATLVVGCFAIIPLVGFAEHGAWVGKMVGASSAAMHGGEEGHGTFLGMNPHSVMYYVSSVVGLLGIAAAWWLHLAGRTSAAHANADKLEPALGPIVTWARHKWYVDEFYDAVIRIPLKFLSNIFYLLDQYLVDGLVNLTGFVPKGLGRLIRPSQSGELHGYALGMAGGLAVLILIVLMVAR
ncbi:MAG: NADH-quinone oxidoreductase subunit L [Tepidisphaera sp.]|nr:NADH-quinone oxidoreductase subunit L [Tepidisphaera sp.]